MSMIERIKEKARADRKTIVFPEGLEPRTVKACAILKAEGIADPVLLGKPEDILREAEELHADLTGIRIVDPEFDAKFSEYAETLYELRKMKGMTREKAAEVAKDPMYFGIMMVKCGDADGLVSGAVHTTGDMLRPALQIIKTKPEMKIVSSSFLMDCPNKEIGEDGLLVYADCVVVPSPTEEELAYIAVAAADTARTLRRIFFWTGRCSSTQRSCRRSEPEKRREVRWPEEPMFSFSRICRQAISPIKSRRGLAGRTALPCFRGCRSRAMTSRAAALWKISSILPR